MISLETFLEPLILEVVEVVERALLPSMFTCMEFILVKKKLPVDNNSTQIK